MPTSLAQEWTEKFTSSPFGRDIFGPKVAQPLARWLSDNFEEPANDELAVDVAAIAGNIVHTQSSGNADNNDTTKNLVGATAQQSGALSHHVAGTSNVSSRDDLRALAGADVAEGLEERPSSLQAFLATLKETSRRIKQHNLVVVAAGIAFWGLLAIPAILFAVVSIAGLVLNPETVKDQVGENLNGLPEEAREIIGGQLEGVSGGNTGGLITGVVLGIVMALWTSSGAMAKLMGALNMIYDTHETRKFAKLRGTALGLTFGGIVFISGAIFLLAAMPALLGSIEALGSGPVTLFNWLRFPLLGLVMVIALGVLYHVGPDRSAGYRPVTAGAAIAMVLWIGLSGLFTIYTSTVASYNETYGSIGGIVILLLWLFITAFVVLLGAEIHAQREVIDEPGEPGEPGVTEAASQA